MGRTVACQDCPDRFSQATVYFSPVSSSASLAGARLLLTDLDLFGPTLANQEVVMFPDVLQDRLVHLVARDPHRLAVDDARQ